VCPYLALPPAPCPPPHPRALAYIPAAADPSAPAGPHDLPPELAAAIPEAQLTAEAAAGWRAWLGAWRGRLAEEGVPEAQRVAAMKAASPKFVPRQHLLQVGGCRARWAEGKERARVGGGGDGANPATYEPLSSVGAICVSAPRPLTRPLTPRPAPPRPAPPRPAPPRPAPPRPAPPCPAPASGPSTRRRPGIAASLSH
jgi:hypothetical protein